MSATTTESATLTLSASLLQEIDEAVTETNLDREALLRAAVRTFLDQERRWREIQDEVSERARAAGIMSEDDVEAFLDAVET